MSGRAAFLVAASVVFAVVLFTAVIRPALERGGIWEVVLIAAAFAGILAMERWLRTR